MSEFKLSVTPLIHDTVVWRHMEFDLPWFFVYGLAVTNKGTILAAAEGRIAPRDESPHHLVLKRSTDGGKTWSKSLFIEYSDSSFWKILGEPDRLECWANGALLANRLTGRVFYFYQLDEGAPCGRNIRRFTRNFYRFSDDDGITWSDRIEITELLNVREDGSQNRNADGNPVLNEYGFPCDSLGRSMHIAGPGHGIQLSCGRLLMHFWNRKAIATEDGPVPEENRNYGLSLIYSDDNGLSWQSGPPFGHELGCNESRIADLMNGYLYVNARTSNTSPTSRGILRGSERGLKWECMGIDPNLPPFAPTDAGLISIWRDKQVILLLTHPADPLHRKDLTLSASFDNGKSWPENHILANGGASYSDIVELPDGSVGILYGKGDAFGYDVDHAPMHEGFDVCFSRLRLSLSCRE
jgi:sialidase-1